MKAAPWRSVSVGFVALLVGLVVVRGLGVAGSLAALGGAVGYLLFAIAILTHRAARRLGAANVVTLVRVVGTCFVGGLAVEAILEPLPVRTRLLLVTIAVICLVLDGVDGRVARARGEVSDFGARFDMETDAGLLAGLSVTVVALGVAGWWALLLAGLRYTYLVASWVIPVLRVPLPMRYSRKVIAVVQAVALCLALVVDLVAPGWPPSIILAAALAVLVWSFGLDIVWQARHAGPPAA